MNHIRYVNPDELYAVFNGDECNRCHKFEVWQTLYQIVHCAEMDNADIIIDTNCLTLGQREEIRSRFPHFDNYQLMVIIANVENSKEWNSKRHRVVPQQELERQARIVDWPNLTDHYNGWNNIDIITMMVLCLLNIVKFMMVKTMTCDRRRRIISNVFDCFRYFYCICYYLFYSI